MLVGLTRLILGPCSSVSYLSCWVTAGGGPQRSELSSGSDSLPALLGLRLHSGRVWRAFPRRVASILLNRPNTASQKNAGTANGNWGRQDNWIHA
jgi:hypothetical protein